MNWEAQITGLLAIAGFSGAFYSSYKNGPISLWMPLVYFSLMGALQAFTHTIADQCALPANQVATWLAYLHVCFQPFFINALALHFIDKRIAGKIDLYVYSACFTAMTIMLIQGYPFNWAGRCEPGSLMCGETLCTVSDNWLLVAMVPITRFEDTVPWYFMTAMALPLLYGSWRFMLTVIAACLLPAWFITHSMNEWPGISALLMIPYLLVVTNLSGMRERMVITRWPGWRTLVTEP